MAELPRVLFGHERGNLTSTRVELINMAKARPAGEKSSEKKISSHIVRNRPGVCLRTVRVWSSPNSGERRFHADWVA